MSRAYTVLSLCGLLSATSIAQTPVDFHPEEQFPAAGGPFAFAIGDLDLNGSPDIAVLNNPGPISVLFSNVPGSFGAPKHFAATDNMKHIAIGELNNDGFPDLLATTEAWSFGPDAVIVLLNTGTGSFTAMTVLTDFDAKSHVALGDLNGDSISDLVIIWPFSDYVSVRLGTGTGSFGPASSFEAVAAPLPGFAVSAQIRDMNGDSKPDIVTANGGSSTVSILLGTGTGSFTNATVFNVGGTPGTPLIGDVNEDGLLDLVASIGGGPNVSVLLGTGAGNLGAPTTFAVAGGAPLALSDMNRDGHSDLVLQGGGSVTVLLGTGTGSFGTPSTVGVGGFVLSVAVADVNVDSKPDLVASHLVPDVVSVLLNATADTAGIPWTYLGHGLEGTGGQEPVLVGNGSLAAGSSNQLSLGGGMPGSLAYLCVGLAAEFKAFHGGVMVPAPLQVLGPFSLDSAGNLQLPFTWLWTPGLTFYLQAWVKDAAAPHGLSATNGLQGAGQ